jgi:hypothetical protein
MKPRNRRAARRFMNGLFAFRRSQSQGFSGSLHKKLVRQKRTGYHGARYDV